ncbi:M61 metallopeptidase family protein [Metapseudomonas furukawaii]|uniref:Peptidase M61 catalytic domain-containing protein n=1 Tax=Metapseudomonas furukawaii TaxID=1149133 RepID=A0AAD1C3F2_METFU|nr:hypothetical protein [Pseudomonas furukawaii]ELS27817.1 Hypothetical protein ppKF707_0936 [Pseudomonas furukawaii]BAU75393.1 hypothetical protein KF707C_37050 [Pseudomonas furukawaii]
MFARPPLLLSALLLTLSAPLWAAKRVDLDYRVRFLPESDQAEVSLVLEKGDSVRSLRFNLGDKGYYSDFESSGGWNQDDPGHGTWVPGEGKASLTYRVRISHPRGDGRFDARMTPDWALLRGDDLVPAATLDMVDGTELVSRLEFELPKDWKSVETGWTRVGKNRFRIDNPERLFDRPTGWIIAGKLGSRRATLGNTDITVSAPVGEQMRRMDILTLMTYIWPYAREVFPREPGKLLIVGANDPMWRGGLSGPNSLFMHSARPLVSENGTSSLVHELVHVLSRIDDTDRSDWITEGVAEYYAIELLRRSGGLGDDRYESVRKHLRQWSRKVDSLRGEHATGPVTARAVLLMQDLDKEIRLRTDGKHSMDDVTRALMRLDKASTRDFIEISENLMGGASDVLDSKLLR